MHYIYIHLYTYTLHTLPIQLDIQAILAHKAIEETPFDDGSGKLGIWTAENFDLVPVDTDMYV